MDRPIAALNVGCGNKLIKGYTNMDIRGPWDEGDADIVDLREGLPYENESFDIVYSAHCLEHFYWHKLKNSILPDIMRVLKEGGILRIAVPDVQKTVELYRDHPYLIPGVLYGGGTWSPSTSFQDTHYFGWSIFTLRLMFEQMGLEDIEEWSPLDIPELKDLDDASHAPCTANIQGIKPIGWKWVHERIM